MELLNHVRVDCYVDGTIIPLFYKDSLGQISIIDTIRQITKNPFDNEVLYTVYSHGEIKKLLKKGDFWYLIQKDDA